MKKLHWALMGALAAVIAVFTVIVAISDSSEAARMGGGSRTTYRSTGGGGNYSRSGGTQRTVSHPQTSNRTMSHRTQTGGKSARTHTKGTSTGGKSAKTHTKGTTTAGNKGKTHTASKNHPKTGNVHKPKHVAHNPQHKVGKLGKLHNHNPQVIAKHGHFFRRSYYWAAIGGVLGWYFWDDAILDDDPIIPMFVSLPVCGDDDSDDCDVQPVSAVYAVPGAVSAPSRTSQSTVGRAQARGGCLVVVYKEPDFDGQTLQTSLDQPTLGDRRWKDAISSIQIFSGNWDFFVEDQYSGDTMTLEPGSYSDLGEDWKDKIGSFRCTPGQGQQ